MVQSDVFSLGDFDLTLFNEVNFLWRFAFLVHDVTLGVGLLLHVLEKRFKMLEFGAFEQMIIFKINNFLVGEVVVVHADDLVVGLV